MDTNNEWLQLTGYKSKQAVIHSSEVYTSLQSMCVCVYAQLMAVIEISGSHSSEY
jgi:hypothetical protein